MSDQARRYLNDAVGTASARRLASAYEAALLAVSLGQLALMPDRRTRLAMVEAMMAEAAHNPLDVEALTHAAVKGAGGW